MLKRISIVWFLLFSATCALGQRDPSGDSWRGRVQTVDASKREITISAVVAKNNETFTGILDQGVTAQLLDDNEKEITASEIPVGMVIRVFYKTSDERVSRQKVKVNHIYDLIFLGRDQFDKLRAFLNVPLTTSVNSADLPLPKSNPLKLYAAIKVPQWNDRLMKWVDRWNKNQAQQYGRLEMISDFARCDLSVVIYEQDIEGKMAGMTLEQRGPITVPSVTAFLVSAGGDPLNILWKQSALLISPMERIEREIETRIKARGQV
jgi:hypothetical protein